MWRFNQKGEKEFCGGKEAYAEAAKIAQECHWFACDAEDELVADEAESCYNCRYRRWTVKSFICCKKNS